jgi:hypothetical protein
MPKNSDNLTYLTTLVKHNKWQPFTDNIILDTYSKIIKEFFKPMFELAADISDLSDCFQYLFNCPILTITIFSPFYKYIHRGASPLPIKKDNR